MGFGDGSQALWGLVEVYAWLTEALDASFAALTGEMDASTCPRPMGTQGEAIVSALTQAERRLTPSISTLSAQPSPRPPITTRRPSPSPTHPQLTFTIPSHSPPRRSFPRASPLCATTLRRTPLIPTSLNSQTLSRTEWEK